MVHSHLGHSHSFDRFLTPSGTLSHTQIHTCTKGLRRWIETLLKGTPGVGSNVELKSDAEKKAESDYRQSTLAPIGCSEEATAALIAAFNAREAELVAHAKSLSVSQFADWSLKDYDWSARVTLASSAISNLRTPTLVLSLLLTSPDGRSRTVRMELDQAGLDSILEQMGRVNQIVQEYSTTTST